MIQIAVARLNDDFSHDLPVKMLTIADFLSVEVKPDGNFTDIVIDVVRPYGFFLIMNTSVVVHKGVMNCDTPDKYRYDLPFGRRVLRAKQRVGLSGFGYLGSEHQVGW